MINKFIDICDYPTNRLLAGKEPISLDTETLGKTRRTNIPIYYSWSARDIGSGAAPVLTRRGFDFLQAICECNRPKVFHNAKFDINVLETHLGLTVPEPLIHDTILMHMLLDEHHLEAHRLKVLSRELLDKPRLDELRLRRAQLAARNNLEVPQPILHEYAEEDGIDTLDLYYLFKPQLAEQGLWELYRHEVLVEMVYMALDRIGVRFDVRAANERLVGINVALGELGSEIYQAFDEEFKISSRLQLGNVLAKHFPLREKTKTGRWKTSHDVLEKYRGNEKMQLVLAWNFLASARGRLAGYERRVAPDGRLHPDYRQTTVTGRSKCRNPNLQSIPHNRGRLTEVEVGSVELAKRCAEAFRQTRQAFTVAPGNVLLAMDYEQVEYRCFAHYSGSERLIRGLQEGQDFHSMVSLLVWGRHDDRLRYLTKVINYGLLYGMGKLLLQQQLRREGKDPRGILQRYEQMLPEMRETQHAITVKARKQGFVTDVFGRRYHLIPERPYAVVAALCQGTAANIKKYAMRRVFELQLGRLSQLIMEIHDELVTELYRADRFLVREMKRAMEDFPQFSVPITTDIAIGPNLLETQKVTIAAIEQWDTAFERKDVTDANVTRVN